jgi:hypothetical protein
LEDRINVGKYLGCGFLKGDFSEKLMLEKYSKK